MLTKQKSKAKFGAAVAGSSTTADDDVEEGYGGGGGEEYAQPQQMRAPIHHPLSDGEDEEDEMDESDIDLMLTAAAEADTQVDEADGEDLVGIAPIAAEIDALKQELDRKDTDEAIKMEALKLETRALYDMVKTVDVDGVAKSIMYVTNRQAELIAGNPESIARLLDAFHITRPRIVINLLHSMGTMGFFDGLADESRYVSGAKELDRHLGGGLMLGQHPWPTRNEAALAEKKLDLFMSEVILPKAVANNAVVLTSATKYNCLLSDAFNRAVAMQRARYGATLPFTVLAFTAELKDYYRNEPDVAEREKLKKKLQQQLAGQQEGAATAAATAAAPSDVAAASAAGGAGGLLRSSRTSSFKVGNKRAVWKDLMSKCAPWSARHREVLSRLREADPAQLYGLNPDAGGLPADRAASGGMCNVFDDAACRCDMNSDATDYIVVEGVDMSLLKWGDKSACNRLRTALVYHLTSPQHMGLPSIAIKTGHAYTRSDDSRLRTAGLMPAIDAMEAGQQLLVLDLRDRAAVGGVELDEWPTAASSRQERIWRALYELDEYNEALKRSVAGRAKRNGGGGGGAGAGGGAAGRRHLVETLDVCSLAYCHDALMASPDGMDIGGYQQESGFLPLFEAIRRERVRREGARGTQGADPFGPASASEIQKLAWQLAEANYRFALPVVHPKLAKRVARERRRNEMDFESLTDIEQRHLTNYVRSGHIPNCAAQYARLLSSSAFFNANVDELDELDILVSRLLKVDQLPDKNPLEGLELLQQMWEAHDTCTHKAAQYERLSYFLYALYLLLAIATVIVTTLGKSVAELLPHGKAIAHITFSLSVAGSLVLSVQGFLNPAVRGNQLRCSAASLESATWLYRTRVGPFEQDASDEGAPERALLDAFGAWRKTLFKSSDLDQTDLKKRYPKRVYKHYQFECPDKVREQARERKRQKQAIVAVRQMLRKEREGADELAREALKRIKARSYDPGVPSPEVALDQLEKGIAAAARPSLLERLSSGVASASRLVGLAKRTEKSASAAVVKEVELLVRDRSRTFGVMDRPQLTAPAVAAAAAAQQDDADMDEEERENREREDRRERIEASKRAVFAKVDKHISRADELAIELVHLAAPMDDFQSPLRPLAYLELRLKPTKEEYQRRVPWLARWRVFWQIVLFLCTAAGTVLSYAGHTPLVAIASSTATSVASWLAFTNLSQRLARHSQTVSALEELIAWWSSLSEVEKASSGNVEELVTKGEAIITNERSSWQTVPQAAKDPLDKYKAKKKKAVKKAVAAASTTIAAAAATTTAGASGMGVAAAAGGSTTRIRQNSAVSSAI